LIMIIDQGDLSWYNHRKGVDKEDINDKAIEHEISHALFL